jgi:hypothetical protein
MRRVVTSMESPDKLLEKEFGVSIRIMCCRKNDLNIPDNDTKMLSHNLTLCKAFTRC